jgi:hypothetical protein
MRVRNDAWTGRAYASPQKAALPTAELKNRDLTPRLRPLGEVFEVDSRRVLKDPSRFAMMRTGHPGRIGRLVSTLLTACAITACGSSATTTTAPSSLTRCGVTVNIPDARIPAAGGAGTVSVTTARECAWTAAVEGPWLSIKAGSTGQGDGNVEFGVSPNTDPVARRGAVLVNGQRADVTQAAGTCEMTLAANAQTFGQPGGSGTIELRASSALCSWTAGSDAPWITVRRDTGQGSAQIPFDVEPTTGPPRTGMIVVAGQQFNITQAEGCSYTIAPATVNTSPAGGPGSVTITTTTGCPWTASSNVPWISFSQSRGGGSATLAFSIAPSSGPTRTGTAVVAGQTFTVTQSQGCTYAVQPLTHSVPAAGGTVTVAIAAGEGCPWTAASEAPWVAVQGIASGSGAGAVALSVAATDGPARTAGVVIAGHRVTVSQGVGCAYSIAPANASVPASGGTGGVTVTAGAGCGWTATSSAPWLSITAGASGSGNGQVQYSAAATSGPSRSATMTIAGHTFTLTQGQGCAYTLSSTSTTIDDGGGQGSFDVRTSAGCGWSAASAVSWITVTPDKASGNGTVAFKVTANNGPSRSGAITAAGQTFTVTQGNGCSYTLSADSHTVPGGGGNGNVNVSTGAACSWTATSNAGWLSITSGANGTGNGTVSFSAASHSGGARDGTLTIAGRTFTVHQAEACAFTISPEQFQAPSQGGTTTVNVTATAGCTWSSASNVSWMRVTSGDRGSGSGPVQFSIDPNTGGSRTGTATIAGRTFTVSQGESCTFTIAPEQVSVDPAGGQTSVAVTAGATCSWTSSSNASWISVSGGNGSGSGTVQLTVGANPGSMRTGTVTIASRTFTVNQGGSCTYSISPSSHNAGAQAGSVTVNVAAADSCTWTATSTSSWLAVVAGAAGSGNGAVQVEVQANTGADRIGGVTIAGQTFTVAQASGCTFAVSPERIGIGASATTGRVDVTTSGNCGWTAVPSATWISVTSSASGTGSGVVNLAFAGNTGPARTGSLTVGGRTVTIAQDAGCTINLSSTAQPAPASGTAGSVNVTTGAGCSWTAVSQVPWIAVTGGASGTGDGAVQFSVDANATGGPRSGTILIGGVTFTINQS